MKKILKILVTFLLLPLNLVIAIVRSIHELYEEFIYDIKNTFGKDTNVFSNDEVK
jgi:inner membrane protein involved in colicin E2 resistance